MNKRDLILAGRIEAIMRDNLTARIIVEGDGRDSRQYAEIVGFGFVAKEIVEMLRTPVGS